MSAGSFIGALINTIAFAAIWTMLGKAVEVITRSFNRYIAVVPSFQDAVNGFNIQETIWGMIMVLILLGIWFNYIANSSSSANMED